MIQIICGVLLVLIGIFVFWKYPIKSDTKSLTLAALLVILEDLSRSYSNVISWGTFSTRLLFYHWFSD